MERVKMKESFRERGRKKVRKKREGGRVDEALAEVPERFRWCLSKFGEGSSRKELLKHLDAVSKWAEARGWRAAHTPCLSTPSWASGLPGHCS